MDTKHECAFNKCTGTATQEVHVPVGTLTNGMPEIAQPHKLAVAPVCDYHFYIVSAGNFIAQEKDGKTVLAGPYGLIEIIESVMAAREMTRKKQPKDKAELARLRRKQNGTSKQAAARKG